LERRDGAESVTAVEEEDEDNLSETASAGAAVESVAAVEEDDEDHTTCVLVGTISSEVEEDEKNTSDPVGAGAAGQPIMLSKATRSLPLNRAPSNVMGCLGLAFCPSLDAMTADDRGPCLACLL
jgi:hypothetical protein